MRRILDIFVVGGSAFALAHCADMNSVVGGACAVGYVEQDNTCVPASPASTNNDGGLTQTDGQTPGNGGDGGQNGDAGPGSGSDGSATNPSSSLYTGPSTVCFAPEILCSGTCIDPTSDPNNCGSCGHVCPSNSCVASKCVGSAPGHVVVIGHDYTTSPTVASSQARVLSNATLIPTSNPLRVMSYEEYASGTAVSNAESLVNAEAKLLGRGVSFVSVTSSSAVSSGINVTSYDVLLVHDQLNAPSGTLGAIGSTWESDGNIATFLHAGGVVVVLTGGTGTAEMPALTTNAQLLSIQAESVISGSLDVLAPADAIGLGVVSPYIPKPSTVSLTTEADGGDVVWVVGQSGAPVVVHKVMP
jgi:hypothetical protein